MAGVFVTPHKMATLAMKRWETNIVTSGQIFHYLENESCKYLGVLEADKITISEIKSMVTKKYKGNCIWCRIKTWLGNKQ